MCCRRCAMEVALGPAACACIEMVAVIHTCPSAGGGETWGDIHTQYHGERNIRAHRRHGYDKDTCIVGRRTLCQESHPGAAKVYLKLPMGDLEFDGIRSILEEDTPSYRPKELEFDWSNLAQGLGVGFGSV